MTIKVPVLDTPNNVVGLGHFSTTLVVNRTLAFNPEDDIYTGTNTGADRGVFVIPYNIGLNEVLFIKFFCTFDNGLRTPDSPVSIWTRNSAIDEISLDNYPAIPATPELSLVGLKNNIPHTNITAKVSKLVFYAGDGILDSTSWYLKDAYDNLLFKSEDDKFNLETIDIDKKYFIKDGIYKIEAKRNLKSSNVAYSTLIGTMIFSASNDSELTDADKALDVNYDEFKLYNNGQSELYFKSNIQGFKYLSVKFYDRNGVLTIDEVKATVSPAKINTDNIEVGRAYTMRCMAVYLDNNNDIRNTRLESREYISEKYTEPSVIGIPDYGDMNELGYIELKRHIDTDIIYFNSTTELLNGMSPIYIKNNIIFLGYWLDSGFVLNNQFINLNPINLNGLTNKIVQMIQKANNDYLLLYKENGTNVSKVITFRTIAGVDNISSIEILDSREFTDSVVGNALLLNKCKRMLFSNLNNENVLYSSDSGEYTNQELLSSTNTINQFVDNVVTLKHTETTSSVVGIVKSGVSSLLKAEIDGGTISAVADFSFKINTINISNLNSLVFIEEINLNSTDDISNEVIADLVDNLFNKGLHTSGLHISVNMLDVNNCIITVEDKKTGEYFRHFRYNLSTKVLSLIVDHSGAGRGYKNIVSAGYNIFRTDINKSPLRLSKK